VEGTVVARRELDGARAEGPDSGDGTKESRFPAAGGPDQHHPLPGRDPDLIAAQQECATGQGEDQPAQRQLPRAHAGERRSILPLASQGDSTD
jgi:hypothetical protein